MLWLVAARPLIATCGPHLVLPNIGHDNGLTFCRVMNGIQNALRGGIFRLAPNTFYSIRFCLLPVADFGKPRTMLTRLNSLCERIQSQFRIRDDGYCRNLHLVHL